MCCSELESTFRFFFVLIFVYFYCMYMNVCLYVCKHIVHILGADIGQEKVPDPLELRVFLKIAVSHCVSGC